MFLDQNQQELDEIGYTVVGNVLTSGECDEYVKEYRDWTSQFIKEGEWPYHKYSIIKGFNVSHFNATWQIRLKAKRVFSEVWKTEKLLTSFDAISIGRPPEDGKESFAKPEEHFLHVDITADRVGLHCYQGTVSLETIEKDDWTFFAVEKSHLYMDEFFATHPKAAHVVCDEDVEWFKSKGCNMVRIPVPKGGMVLWDSRLLHANAKPIQGRRNPGRWRYCVFVSMTPAIWATQKDLEIKKQTYKELGTTGHFSSQGITVLDDIQTRWSETPLEVTFPKSLPHCAKIKEAQQLSGVIPYNFNDGQSNGPNWFPRWK